MGGIALLGNGLKSIVTSTVLVSEARFAAFLGIAVESVALLMETIVAGMVIALAAYPLALRRYPVRAIAIVAALAAAAAFAAFAAFAGHASGASREAWAYGCLTLGGAAIVWLAPSAQSLVLAWPGNEGRRALTSLWTGATPAGFLAAPQLAKWLLPSLGLSAYFATFAAMPLAFAALVATCALVPAGVDEDALPASVVIAFVATVIAFEAWSTAGSLRGYLAPATLASLPLLALAVTWLVQRARRFAQTAMTATGATAWWSLAALFALEIPTTGFFEAAFLYDRGMSETLVADRATLAAMAQVAGTLVAGVALHRDGEHRARVAWIACALAILGVAGYAAYPWGASVPWFMATAAVAGLGVGGLTLVLCLAIVRGADRAATLAALPSIAIMIGTEFGLEMLQGVSAAASAVARDPFAVLFIAQALAACAVVPLLARALRAGAAET
ncbi:MAG: hypothetical protein U1F54_17395 [Burkholderiales bacterium]